MNMANNLKTDDRKLLFPGSNNTINGILENAPKDEPARQHYFLDVLKEYVSGFSSAPCACVVTFGCQMNARDSEKLEGILRTAGYRNCADEQEADLVIFNTCTVRENANEHLYGRLGHLKSAMTKHPERVLAVCGCMMQESDEVEKLRRKYPYVDLIFGTHNLFAFPELLFHVFCKRQGVVDRLAGLDAQREVLVDSSQDAERMDKLLHYAGTDNSKDIRKLCRKPVISVWKDSSEIVEDLPSERKYPFKQGINIMFGCNNFCSYCIVPYVRGREKSRQPGEILEEIRRAGSEGVREIMLLGQNVNSYRGISTAGEKYSFPMLLEQADRLAEECGISRIRFMTSHPKDLSDELMEVMASAKHVCRQFHLPLQSGSSRILKRMNRVYDRERYLERAARLRETMPDISISTDIIVGFPGETEEDFLETLDVVRQVRFDAAYTFIYSKREGTPAAAYADQVPADVVKERFDRLLQLQNTIVSDNLRRRLGMSAPVLFEEVSEYDPQMVTGKLESGITVHVQADPLRQPSLIGQIADVKLTECHGFYYTGELNGYI